MARKKEKRVQGAHAGIDWSKVSMEDLAREGRANISRRLGVTPGAVSYGLKQAKSRTGEPVNKGGRKAKPVPPSLTLDLPQQAIQRVYQVSAPTAQRWRRELKARAAGEIRIDGILTLAIISAMILGIGQVISRIAAGPVTKPETPQTESKHELVPR